MIKILIGLLTFVFCNSIQAGSPIEFPRRAQGGEWILNAGASSFAFSPDEKILASAGNLGIFLVDLQSDNLDIEKWIPIENEIIESINFSPNGESLLTVNREINNPNHLICIWDLQTGNMLRTIEIPQSQLAGRYQPYASRILNLDVSPNQTYILTGNADSTATLLDFNTGAVIHHLDAHTYQRTDIGYDSGTTAVAFSPNGESFLTGGRDGVIKMWDTNSGSELRQYKSHVGSINNLRFTQDGARFLSNTKRRSDDRTIIVWDAASGHVIAAAPGHTDLVSDIQWIDNDRRIISTSQDATIKIWDAQTGSELQSIPSENPSGLSLLSPQNNFLYKDTTYGLQEIWDISDLNAPISKTLDFHTLTDGIILHDNQLFVTEENNKLLFWKFENGAPIQTHEISIEDSFFTDLSFSRDGKYMLGISYPDETLRIWELSNIQVVYKIAEGDYGNKYTDVNYVEISPDRKRLAVVFSDGYVRILDWETGEVVQSYSVQGTAPAWATFSPDGEKILTCHVSHSRYYVRLWDIKTGEMLRSHERIPTRGSPIPIRTIEQWGYAGFINDEMENASTIVLWDGFTGEENRIILDRPNLVKDFHFSQDGRFVWAEESYVGVNIFDVSTGRSIRTFPHAMQADISHDMSWAVTSGYGTVRLWDLKLSSYVRHWQAIR